MSCNVVYDKSRTGTFTQRVVDDTGISVEMLHDSALYKFMIDIDIDIGIQCLLTN